MLDCSLVRASRVSRSGLRAAPQSRPFSRRDVAAAWISKGWSGGGLAAGEGELAGGARQRASDGVGR